MAQFLKDEIKTALLDAARKEFLEKGFNGASMRGIATLAGQNSANIYNYFKNKEDLFYHLVEPTITVAENGLRMMAEWKPSSNQPLYSIDDERAVLFGIIDYVDANRDEVTLLTLKAQGSKYEKWFDQTTRELARMFQDIIADVVAFDPDNYSNQPSEFFILNLIRFLYNGVLSMLKHGMCKAEMIEKSEELLIFYYTGLTELIKKH